MFALRYGGEGPSKCKMQIFVNRGRVGARVSANVHLYIFERLIQTFKEKGIQKWAGIVIKIVKRSVSVRKLLLN